MRLIEPKAELLIQPNGLEGIYKQIELAGRTCYKSIDKITEDSAKPFVDRMINSNHLAMLEHGTVYLRMAAPWDVLSYREAGKYTINKYSKIVGPVYTKDKYEEGERRYSSAYITTNLRVLVENGWLDDFKYVCEPTEYHEKRYTFRCITSIGVTREMNRHRVDSIAEQSTRYCNYSKDKFGGEVTFCIPEWIDSNSEYNTKVEIGWLASIKQAERNYLQLLKEGWQPQQAREVLPLCTATEIVHTAFASDWRHFFDLRYFGTTGKPHPNMLQLATLMKEEAEKYGIWDKISNKQK